MFIARPIVGAAQRLAAIEQITGDEVRRLGAAAVLAKIDDQRIGLGRDRHGRGKYVPRHRDRWKDAKIDEDDIARKTLDFLDPMVEMTLRNIFPSRRRRSSLRRHPPAAPSRCS